ncbi:MAG TPA: permease prefix domain 1-containing protein [Dehalococcoidia bacterium]|nr:permease prefix domain 1-containing protein [Dehalococcoidia bacterium]
MESTIDPSTEAQIREWKSYLLRRKTIHHIDVDELEDHLRSQMSELGAAGLSGDESFLVAIKRIGGVNELTREFARERSSKLWKQLVLAGDSVRERSGSYAELLITICFAIGAAVAFKLPAAFGIDPFDAGTSDSATIDAEASFYLRNTSLLALPFLIGFLTWKRSLAIGVIVGLAVPFVAAAILVNVFPFHRAGDTELLAAIHLPIILWLVAGVAYLGGAWRADAPRMDFVRFTGEWFIYYTLIALGGVVLVALTVGVFEAIEIDVGPIVGSWVLPCGAVGAIVVVAWLVEAKQSVIENMAPVLTTVFTPLFALMLVAAILGMALTGNAIDAERDVLILLDVLLVLVLGLVLYSFSARDSDARPTLMDAVQLVLVVSALMVDVLALASILSRITEFGFTPNRTAGLGLNVALLANLMWSAWLLTAFLRGWRQFSDLERWQTTYIPVYAVWAAIVVVVFPPLFAFG